MPSWLYLMAFSFLTAQLDHSSYCSMKSGADRSTPTQTFTVNKCSLYNNINVIGSRMVYSFSKSSRICYPCTLFVCVNDSSSNQLMNQCPFGRSCSSHRVTIYSVACLENHTENTGTVNHKLWEKLSWTIHRQKHGVKMKNWHKRHEVRLMWTCCFLPPRARTKPITDGLGLMSLNRVLAAGL